MGRLLIVSTPIGNRGDISLRALESLFGSEIVLCEDTRKTGQLLRSYQEDERLKDILRGKSIPELVSFYEENEEKRIPQVIEWLKEGKTIALASNAGTPLLSDPGFKLVRECVREKISVSPIPGASALLAGLTISGLAMDKFMFLGFLPKKQGKKDRLFSDLKQITEIQKMTIVFYESPFRILKTLKTIEKIMPEARVVIARELTKKFEEAQRGTAEELMKELEGKRIKGEMVVILERRL